MNSHYPDTTHRKPWISDAIMVSLNRKHELFRVYIRMSLLPLIIIILLKTISQLLYVMWDLNSLFRCKNTSKSEYQQVSDPLVIAEVFNNYFSKVASYRDHNIPH